MLSPDQAHAAEAKAFSRAHYFITNPQTMRAAGYKSINDFIRAKRQRIERELQAWERAQL